MTLALGETRSSYPHLELQFPQGSFIRSTNVMSSASYVGTDLGTEDINRATEEVPALIELIV